VSAAAPTVRPWLRAPQRRRLADSSVSVWFHHEQTGLVTQRVYLDTHQWSYFARPATSVVGFDVNALVDGASRGEFEIVGSVDIVQELVAGVEGLDDSDVEAIVGEQVRLLLRLAGPRLLRCFEERLPMESANGGTLPVRRRFLPANQKDELRRLLSDHGELRKVAAEFRQQKTNFEDKCTVIRDRLVNELSASGEAANEAGWVEWAQTSDRAEWVDETLRAAPAGSPSPKESRLDHAIRFPSLWRFISYQQIRVALTTGGKRKIKGSDLADARHVAASAYYDVLVTDDRALRDGLECLGDHSYRWMTSRAFASEFLGG
jgi:hypothetical protein